MHNIIVATYKKNRLGIKRAYPWSFIFGRLVGGIFAVIFPYFIYTYFFKGHLDSNFYIYTQKADYITYVVLGAAIHVLGMATLMNVGRTLITELREGTLEAFLISPASRNGYFIGCMIEQIGRSCLEFGTVLLVGWLFGAKLGKIFSFQSIIVICITIFSFFAMALTLSSLMLYTRDTYISQNTLFFFMSLACGISFPIEYLPIWLQRFSHIFPMTAALKLFRAVIILNEDISAHTHLVLEIVLLSIIYIIIGLLWFVKIERKLIEDIFG